MLLKRYEPLTTFDSLNLIEPLQRAVAAQNYVNPTPIQAGAIPPLLEGRDVLGCAQTGTGKTAAFALPVLQHIAQQPPTPGKARIRALVLSPTRELAAQIGENFEAYSQFLSLRHLVIFGGVNENPQIAALRKGIDVLVATPGRLLDLMGRGFIDLSEVGFFVLDEADRMLDMGFIRDIRRVLQVLPPVRQNLLFSATMPPDIVKLASEFLSEPVRVEVAPEATTVELIDQHVMFVERANKRRLLAWLLHEEDFNRAIVFTRTKHGANRLCRQLEREGIRAAPIHGNKSQNARRRALDGFKSGEIPVLVATDIASRGIDVEGVTHVFNFDLPNEPESYVHRIGRTGRAGREGVAIAFCDPTEGEYLRDIERLIGMSIPVDNDHDWHCAEAVPPPLKPSRSRRGGGGGRKKPARKPQNNSGRGRRGQGRADRGQERKPAPKPAAPPSPDRDAQEPVQQAAASGPAKDGDAPTDAPRRKRRRRRRRRKPAAGVPIEGGNKGQQQGRSGAPAASSKPDGQPNASGDRPEGQKRRRRRRRRRRNPAAAPAGGAAKE